MICDTCHGNGYITRAYIAGVVDVTNPCPDCGGCGVTSCCDGDQPSVYDQADELEPPDIKP